MKEIVITNKAGITLNTKKTLVDDDIKIKLDKSILKEEPKGKIEITTTDEVDVSGYETAQVVDDNLEPQNIAKDVNILGVVGTYEGGSSGNTLKNLLDNTKSAQYLFYGYKGDNLSDLIQYNDTENVTSFMSMYESCSSATNFPSLNASKVTNFGNMYSYCTKSTTFPQLDTSQGTTFQYMYNSCSNATTFPQLNTSNGTIFQNMYNGCSNATSFPQLNTSNGTNFKYMYYGCGGATEFPKLDTSKGTNFAYMYYGCRLATKIDISKFTSTSTSNSQRIWYYCYSLKALIIRSFGDTYVLDSKAFFDCVWLNGDIEMTYNPNGEQGYIYVPRDMISILQAETNWSVMQFRALEDYTLDGTTTGEFDDAKAGL